MRNLSALAVLFFTTGMIAADDAALVKQFKEVQPVLRKLCFKCHSTEAREGELDLERFKSVKLVRDDLKPWQAMIQQLETREMPPKDEPQPTDAQRTLLIDWSRRLLDSEARARAGDPGRVPLHRLSNTEYDNTIRDLTGVNLRPARDFPADGAAGEGFTNAAQALNMSPAMMAKYVIAARKTADHAVLLPDGFRFSKSATRRDWTDESLAELRKFYRQFTSDGSLPLKPYIAALVEHRNDVQSNKLTLKEIAASRNLSPKYLQVVWQALEGDNTSFPLDRIRAVWKNATANDVDRIVAEVSPWFARLWEFPRIGSYVNTHRQIAKNPAVVETANINVKVQPKPGQNEVVLYFVAHELTSENANSSPYVIWDNPRFEGDNLPPLSLSDYSKFGAKYEVDFATLFENTEAYLDAAIIAANDTDLSLQKLAAKHGVDEQWLKRWITVMDVKPFTKATAPIEPGRTVPKVAWQLLDELTPNPDKPAISGWKPKDEGLPILISNSSDKLEQVPGRMSPHKVAVHPTPTEFVAAVWKSPLKGRVRVSGKVSHAHPSCGNGVAWWVEKQSLARSAVIAEGAVDLGKGTSIAARELNVVTGDFIFLAIGARDANHSCDLTEIELTISEIADEKGKSSETKGRVWNLATDIADNIAEGNPHADKRGNKDVWSFVRGASKDRPAGSTASLDANNILTRWRNAAATSGNQAETKQLAKQLRVLLTGNRPSENDKSSRAVYDQLVSVDGPLLKEVDVTRLQATSKKSPFGFAVGKFGKHPSGQSVNPNSLVLQTDKVIEIRLPAALFRNRQFVVGGKLDANSAERAVQFQVLTEPPSPANVWKSTSLVAEAEGPGHKRLLAGLAEFRSLFPPNVCYPHIIPLDEVVCLKTFHREDEPLIRLFLDDIQTSQLEKLWLQHRFITRFPVVENEYLPLFIGFVTQDQPKSLVKFFEDKRPEFQRWADEFESDFELAAPRQIKQLLDFAAHAYRRPLESAERKGLSALYQQLRNNEIPHEESFRSVLARVLLSPSFLLHLEQSPEGNEAQPVNDWELASRLSYFLWASTPDEELRQLAAANRLNKPKILEQQARRMLKDQRVRALAIEFGTQWIHVRGFDRFNEKNEKLFPKFDTQLRNSMNEEPILFFQDLFQNDRAVVQVLDADYTFLNQELAKHYGIDGVDGEQWRRVDGVKKFGRGGILGFASVQSKQAGASRTSPVLRGNWVVETLLGEKLPRPPPNVPQLPDSEIGNGGLTMREITQKHVSDAQCATCHQRIDPFGFALEMYDPIGRLRKNDLGGLPVDSKATLRDGTEFEGLDGLRSYLLKQKKETFVRLFYQRLLGYALGRSVSISDQLLIDKMMEKTDNGDDGVSNAVILILQSPQFRMIRGARNTDEN